MDSGAFRNTARDALLRRLGVQPVQTTQAFAPAATTGGYTPATTAYAPATGSGPTGTADEVPDGKTCTSNRDCGNNKTCIDGTCQKPNRQDAGRQCLRKSDCPPGKKCVNGNCTADTGGGTEPTPEPPVDDGTCDPPCAAGQSCTNGTCTTPTPGGGGGSGEKCSTTAQCRYGEECRNGTCQTPPGEREQINNMIEQDRPTYLGNLARTATLQAEGGTAFGNFLAQRAFPNIETAFEQEALTDPNLKFKTWLSRQQRYGMPNLEMLDAGGNGDGGGDGDAPDPGAGETCSRQNPNGSCNGANRVCRNGRCKKVGGGAQDADVNAQAGGGNGGGAKCADNSECGAGERCGKKGKCRPVECNGPTCGDGKTCINGICEDDAPEQLTPDYENVQGFANYLRDLYYGASSTDRGQQNARFGQGATRWSAW